MRNAQFETAIGSTTRKGQRMECLKSLGARLKQAMKGGFRFIRIGKGLRCMPNPVERSSIESMQLQIEGAALDQFMDTFKCYRMALKRSVIKRKGQYFMLRKDCIKLGLYA